MSRTLHLPLRALVLIVAVVAFGGCAKRVREVPVYTSVETYLSTPSHNDITQAHALRRCLGLGRNAVWRRTEARGPGRYRHVYECV